MLRVSISHFIQSSCYLDVQLPITVVILARMSNFHSPNIIICNNLFKYVITSFIFLTLIQEDTTSYITNPLPLSVYYDLFQDKTSFINHPVPDCFDLL